MGNLLGRLLSRGGTQNAPDLMRSFTVSDPTLSRDVIAADGDAWRIETEEAQVVRLYEVAGPDVEHCRLVFRATMKAEGLQGRAFLEMWVRMPGRGEFFSKGFNQSLKGTVEWGTYEIPFFLKKGQRPDLIKLNVAVEGRGKVWIKDIELLKIQR